MDQGPTSEQLRDAPKPVPRLPAFWLVGGAGLCAVLAWAYWPTLEVMADRWSRDPRYSHGYLVPLFAAFLLWFRRDLIPLEGFRPSWSGLALLLFGVGLYLVGGRFFYVALDPLSLLPVVAGLVVFLGGWRALAWAWPSVLF